MLVCKECRALGKRPHDVSFYFCHACKSKLGWAKFDDKALRNAKARGSHLTCKKCQGGRDERLKILQQRLKQSKMVCTCFCPIHRERCPMSHIYYSEKRWPGADGHISWFDYAFLSSLKPPPKWWTKAWGRNTEE